MQNQKLFSILALSMVLLAVANAQATYANYCNIQAAANKRFNTQYSGDISAQRCSFCQYQDTDNGEDSGEDTGNDNQVKGCSVCPSYTTATCTTCKENYVSTTANICIPCPIGSTCCAGNIASQDTYYQTAVKNAPNTYNGLATVYSQLRTYTGLRQMTCKTGYVALGHYCAKIPANCASFVPKDNYYYCTQCQAGYYFGKDNECLKDCTASYYSANDVINTGVGCAACASESKCLTCSTQVIQGAVTYYYLDPSSSVTEKNKEAGTPASNPTQTTIQICRQCPDNCVECTNGTTCKTCATHYFLSNGGTCTKCTDPTELFIASQSNLAPISYSACSSTSVVPGSYTWVQGLGNTGDTLNVASTRPLKTLGTGQNTKYAYCEDKCTACEAKADNTGTNCTSCINGWFVDKSDPTNVICTKCPEHSVLCKWNDNLKKDNTNKNPQVIACAVNTADLRPPYKTTRYLQYDFAVSSFTEQNYDQNNQCIENKNSCKTMINKFDGTNSVEAQCSECYKASDFAINSPSRSDYFLTKDKKCLPCDLPNAKTCELNTDQTALQIKTCVDGFYPSPQSNACKSCKDIFEGCTTCNNDGVCLSCDSTTYFTLTTGGKITACTRAYEENTVQKANCLNWGTDSTAPTNYSCKACAPGSVLISPVDVTTSTNDTYQVSLCMSCPKYCSSCGSAKNRAVCNSCIAGYYLSNNTCLALPKGCASFNGTKCTYCLYGYRLINDQWCSSCVGDYSFSGGQWFDCPGAQCPQGSSDSPTSSSSETSSTILSVVSLCLFVFALLI